MNSVSETRILHLYPGVLPEKLGGGVRPTPQNPNPIHDQNLRFSPTLYYDDLKK